MVASPLEVARVQVGLGPCQAEGPGLVRSAVPPRREVIPLLSFFPRRQAGVLHRVADGSRRRVP